MRIWSREEYPKEAFGFRTVPPFIEDMKQGAIRRTLEAEMRENLVS